MASLAELAKKLFGGAAAGAGTTFLRDTDEGRALVKSTVRDKLIYYAPWFILGGVVLGVILFMFFKRKGRR